jgi:hypothetical protein
MNQEGLVLLEKASARVLLSFQQREKRLFASFAV